jgi:ankyrin repeat protein
MGFPDEEKAFKAIQRVVYGPLGNTMLHQAVVQGDKERVESIINRDPYKLAEKNKEGESPLQLAVTRKDLDMVCLLLDYYRSIFIYLFYLLILSLSLFFFFSLSFFSFFLFLFLFLSFFLSLFLSLSLS